VDATSLLDRATGVGVFTREVLTGLTHLSDIEPLAFAVSQRERGRLPSVVPKGVEVVGRGMPARLARWVWMRSNRLTAATLVGRRIDLVHGPNFVVPPGGRADGLPVAEVVTVHDLTAVRYPKLCTDDVLQWPPLLRRAIGRGAWVHTVSSFVADEVREAFPGAADRVVAVPNGVTVPPPPGSGTDAVAGRNLAGGDHYVLAVGTVEPRKDLPSLVAAFDALAGSDAALRLVIAGPDGWGADALTDAVDRSPHRARIVRLGWVDDDQRLALMRGAEVVAYPSRYEGFGLVPLEALTVGTPVVATRVGALPEVLGDRVPLVPPDDPDALAQALDRILTDDAARAEVLTAGRDRAASFRWDTTVAGLHDLYRRAADARSR
jgi:glycosyltransferase involved in cell wall biosynthesis